MTETEVNTSGSPHDGDGHRLQKRLSEIRLQASGLGVTVAYDVHTPEGNRYGRDRDARIFAASLAKVPLAILMARDERIEPDKVLKLHSSDARSGAGDYDDAAMRKASKQLGELEDITVSDLATDMLVKSGETAYKVLARYYASAVDPQVDVDIATVLKRGFSEEGWNDTTAFSMPHAVEIGTTSPQDMIAQFDRLHELAVMAQEGSLAELAWNSLGNNIDTSNGVRSFRMAPNTELVNKTGAYNGDPEDDHVYRHDAGVIILPTDEELKYVFMIRTDRTGKLERAKAKIIQDRMAGEIARYAGAHVPRFLGLRALI